MEVKPHPKPLFHYGGKGAYGSLLPSEWEKGWG
jgi:hypothetical protein